MQALTNPWKSDFSAQFGARGPEVSNNVACPQAGDTPSGLSIGPVKSRIPRGVGVKGDWLLSEKGKEICDNRVRRPSCKKMPRGLAL